MTRLLRLAALAIVVLGLPRTSHADFIVYFATLNGPSESPPNASLGTGSAEVDVDTTANTMRVQATFSGLTGNTTASHIHSPTGLPGVGTAGVATTTPTFPMFPLGVTSGTYDQTFDMTLASSYNPAFITANGGTPASAEAALFAGLAGGRAYLNIHSTAFPGGEIRGFLATLPEPASVVLLAAGGLGILAYSRRSFRRGAC
jgi:CHRD domain-containing protein